MWGIFILSNVLVFHIIKHNLSQRSCSFSELTLTFSLLAFHIFDTQLLLYHNISADSQMKQQFDRLTKPNQTNKKIKHPHH